MAGKVWFEERFPQHQVKRPFDSLLSLRNCFVFVWPGMRLELVGDIDCWMLCWIDR